MSCKIEGKSRTPFITHRKRICRVRLTITLVLYSAHTPKTHILSKVDFKSHTLSSTHRKLTCRVSLTTTLVLHTAHTKHTCRVRLTTTLLLYSICTKTHVSREIASSLALYSKRIGTHLSIKIAVSPHSIWHAQETLDKDDKVRMTCRTLIGGLRKRTCQLRLTINLILYSARTENAHVK